MAFKVLALASGVTGLADHRILNSGLVHGAGQLQVRGGVLPGQGGLDLTTVSAMTCRINPGKVVVPNGVSSSLGPYVLVSDSTVDIEFDAGEASVPRTDRIIARVYDDTNDGSGSTEGSIEYLKGQASGSATSLPTNSILLYDMVVPAGASAGGGGINFANAVDQRLYTTANGGVIPILNNTQLTNVSNPYEGMFAFRKDNDFLMYYDGSAWRPAGQISVPSESNLTSSNLNPVDGTLAVTRDNDALFVYNGSAWRPANSETPICYLENSSAVTCPSGSGAIMTWETEIIDSHGFHSTVTNNDRVTPNIPGVYRVDCDIVFAFNQTITYTSVGVKKNGTTIRSSGNVKPNATNNVNVAGGTVWDYVECNGSTDYITIIADQVSTGGVSRDTNTTAGFRSRLSVRYERPLI